MNRPSLSCTRTRIKVSAALVMSLAACTSPTRREAPDEFALVASGRVNSAVAPQLVECLMDGFDGAHWAIINVYIRQQRRAAGYRIETFTGPSLLSSADVLDDGRAELRESSAAAGLNVSGEREAFAACLAKFGTLK